MKNRPSLVRNRQNYRKILH